LQWSALADAKDLPGLNFATSESTDEDIIRLITFGDTLVVMKSNSIEKWLVTGLADDEAFTLITGSVFEVGLRGFDLICNYPNGIAFAASDGRVYAWNGAQLQPISTPQLEATMKLNEPIRVLFYEARGHAFICVAFEGIPAWCYDIATGLWHERAEGVNFGPWSAVESAKFGAGWVVASNNGQIRALVETPVDADGPLCRDAFSRTLELGRRVTVPLVELGGNVGFKSSRGALVLADDGIDLMEAATFLFLGDEGEDSGPPKVQVRFSRDAVTYGPEKVRSFGEIGRYETRMTFRTLGQFRRMTMWVRMTSPVETPINTDVEVMAI
jgi:hypothetical protein